MITKQNTTWFLSSVAILACLLLLQIDKIIFATFLNVELNSKENLARLSVLCLFVFTLQFFKPLCTFKWVLPSIAFAFSIFMFLQEATHLVPGYGNFAYQTELMFSFALGIMLSQHLTKTILINVVFVCVLGFFLILTLISLDIIKVQGIMGFDALCSRPTWKFVNKYSVLLSFAILLCVEMSRHPIRLLLFLLCVVTIWMLKSRASLLLALIAIGYIYLNGELFFKKRQPCFSFP